MVRAAILRSPDGRLEMVDVALLPPGPGEVEVAVAVSSVCEHDLESVRAHRPERGPLVPGHGGAGTVVRVGAGVTGIVEGDRVVVCGPAHCGSCLWCRRGQGSLCPAGTNAASAGTLLDGTPRMTLYGRTVSQLLAIGTYSAVTVVPQNSVVPIHPSIDLATAALITCGVLEGMGAATRAASITPSDVVVVIGNGSVGRNALQGARFAGAGAILVLGEDTGTLEEDLGATHATAQPAELGQWIADLTQGRGADVVIDTVGAPEGAKRALGWTRCGGQVILTTADSSGSRISLDIGVDIVAGARSIRGVGWGGVHRREEVPILLELHESGLLRLDWPRSVIAPIEDANDVLSLLDFGDLEQARLIHS